MKLLEFQKKITTLIEQQRRRFRTAEESLHRTNEKIEAITKKDNKRHTQLQKQASFQIQISKTLDKLKNIVEDHKKSVKGADAGR